MACRKPFEDAIKRPYFHVKPLDGNQLTAWSRLLNYVEARGNDDVTLQLYERCLVACAKYPGKPSYRGQNLSDSPASDGVVFCVFLRFLLLADLVALSRCMDV